MISLSMNIQIVVGDPYKDITCDFMSIIALKDS